MQNRPIRVITFDFDDTFWDAKPVLINAENQVYDWLKVHAPKVTDQFTVERLSQWRWNKYKNTPHLAHQISQLRIDTMQQIMKAVGYSSQISSKLSKEAYEVFIHARHKVTLFDDVMPMLKQLSDQYILGTLTNGNADVSKLPIGHLFEFSYRAEQLNASKPSPELFIAAQQIAQCKAHEIIHVGDHIEHDVFGAYQAGCHALWYNPTKQNHPNHHYASMEVQSIADIPQAISEFEKSLSAD